MRVRPAYLIERYWFDINFQALLPVKTPIWGLKSGH
jgi:hypothetical protein